MSHLLLVAALALAQPQEPAAAIRAEIVRGAAAFERGDPETILDHYARDVVLSYPGEPDQDYGVLARQYAELRSRPKGLTARTIPTFDEVLVSGELAIVRLRWTTTISDSTGRSGTRYLKDLQVWRKEPNGRWLFVRGMHYREPPDSTPARELIALGIARAGGEAALTRAKAFMWDGDAVVHVGGRDIRIAGQWSVQPPDSGVIATYDAARGPSTARSLVVAAPRGWMVSDGRFAPMPDGMLANERDAFYVYDVIRLLSLRDASVTLTRIAPDSLAQRGARATRPNRPDVDLYFDPLGRLAHVRMMVHDATSGKPIRQDAWLAGEIVADGVHWPREIRFTNDGAPYFDLTLRTLKTLPRLTNVELTGPRP